MSACWNGAGGTRLVGWSKKPPGGVTALLSPVLYNRRKMRRSLSLAIAIAITALAIAGCGSSGKPSRAAGAAQGIKFADCMRAHGVPSFPDPSGDGGGIQISSSSGINPASPAFQAARSSCGKLLPGGGPGAHQATAQQKATMLHLSQCMRAHGISGFPDPTSSPPASPVGFSIAFGSPGAFLAVPNTINPESPEFKRAATACSFPGA